MDILLIIQLSLKNTKFQGNIFSCLLRVFSAGCYWCQALAGEVCEWGSAWNLHSDSGVGHSLPRRLYCKCHTPPPSKLYINNIPQSLNTYTFPWNI